MKIRKTDCGHILEGIKQVLENDGLSEIEKFFVMEAWLGLPRGTMNIDGITSKNYDGKEN